MAMDGWKLGRHGRRLIPIIAILAIGCAANKQGVASRETAPSLAKSEVKPPANPIPAVSSPVEKVDREVLPVSKQSESAAPVGSAMLGSAPVAGRTFDPPPVDPTALAKSELLVDPVAANSVEAEPVPTDPEKNLAAARKYLERAKHYYSAIPNYSCRTVRQERVSGKILPRETMLLNFREKPRSVFYKWLDEKNAGRECIWEEGKNGGKIVSRGGRGDFLFVGRRMSVDPNGFMAKSRSRYSIKESGLDRMVRRLEVVIERQERGDLSRGKVRYAGLAQREEWPNKLHYIVHEIPRGADEGFPIGALRHWYFDTATGQLVLMHADDSNNEFVEYYLFDRFIPNDSLSDQDFDPDSLWPGAAEKKDAEPKSGEMAPTRVSSRPAKLPE